MELRSCTSQIDKDLFDALYALMQDHVLEELTVNDILSRAHVSRSTFYRRYPDKYALLNACYHHLLSETFLLWLGGIPWKEASSALYRRLSQHPRFFKHAFASHGPDSLHQYICDLIEQCVCRQLCAHGLSPDSDWRLQTTLRAYIYGTMEMTCRWAREGMPYPAEEFVSLLCEIMPESLRIHCL